MGSWGYPTGHLGIQICIFDDLGWMSGPSWAVLWVQFLNLFMIFGRQSDDLGLKLIFNDWGMEIVPESDAGMCLSHSEY